MLQRGIALRAFGHFAERPELVAAPESYDHHLRRYASGAFESEAAVVRASGEARAMSVRADGPATVFGEGSTR